MMLNWLDAIPNLAPEHLAGTPTGTPGTPRGTPQIQNNLLKNKEEHRKHREHRKKGVPQLILRAWHDHLSPLAGTIHHNGWQQARDDAFWIYENFASRAVRDGWSAHDLFGVFPNRPGWGGLCDRLNGARNLKMDQNRAIWSNFGLRDKLCLGAGDDLIPSGLTLIWQLASSGDPTAE